MWVRSAHANVIRHANVTVQRKAMFRANAPNSIFFFENFTIFQTDNCFFL